MESNSLNEIIEKLDSEFSLFGSPRQKVCCFVCDEKIIPDSSKRFYAHYLKNFCSLKCLCQYHFQISTNQCYLSRCGRPMNPFRNVYAKINLANIFENDNLVYLFDETKCWQDALEEELVKFCSSCGKVIDSNNSSLLSDDTTKFCSPECFADSSLIETEPEAEEYLLSKCMLESCDNYKNNSHEQCIFHFHFGNFCCIDHSVERCNLLVDSFNRLEYCAGCPRNLPFPKQMLAPLIESTPENERHKIPLVYPGRDVEFFEKFQQKRKVTLPFMFDQGRLIKFCTDDCYFSYCKAMSRQRLSCSYKYCSYYQNQQHKAYASFLQVYKNEKLEGNYCSFSCLLNNLESTYQKIQNTEEPCLLCQLSSKEPFPTIPVNKLEICWLHRRMFVTYERLVDISSIRKNNNKPKRPATNFDNITKWINSENSSNTIGTCPNTPIAKPVAKLQDESSKVLIDRTLLEREIYKKSSKANTKKQHKQSRLRRTMKAIKNIISDLSNRNKYLMECHKLNPLSLRFPEIRSRKTDKEADEVLANKDQPTKSQLKETLKDYVKKRALSQALRRNKRPNITNFCLLQKQQLPKKTSHLLKGTVRQQLKTKKGSRNIISSAKNKRVKVETKPVGQTGIRPLLKIVRQHRSIAPKTTSKIPVIAHIANRSKVQKIGLSSPIKTHQKRQNYTAETKTKDGIKLTHIHKKKVLKKKMKKNSKRLLKSKTNDKQKLKTGKAKLEETKKSKSSKVSERKKVLKISKKKSNKTKMSGKYKLDNVSAEKLKKQKPKVLTE